VGLRLELRLSLRMQVDGQVVAAIPPALDPDRALDPLVGPGAAHHREEHVPPEVHATGDGDLPVLEEEGGGALADRVAAIRLRDHAVATVGPRRLSGGVGELAPEHELVALREPSRGVWMSVVCTSRSTS
jgi:hypothetical protein